VPCILFLFVDGQFIIQDNGEGIVLQARGDAVEVRCFCFAAICNELRCTALCALSCLSNIYVFLSVLP
jgi:hypothetical protein